MRIALPNAAEVNESNVVQTLRQVIRALESETDLGGHHDTQLHEEVRELRGDIVRLEQKVDDGFQELRTEMRQTREDLQSEIRQTREDLQSEMQQAREETVDLLRIIAKNTEPKA